MTARLQTAAFGLVLALLSPLVVGCNEYISKAASVSNAAGDSLTYDQVYSAVLGPRCAACHGKSGGYSVETLAATLTKVKPGDAAGSRLCSIIDSGYMPPGDNDLSDDQVKLVCDWIDQGAL